jgi:hypothetical protein
VSDRSEGFGERLLGSMIERAHEMPPHLIATLVADVIAAIGARDVAVYLQDYDQHTLISMPGPGLLTGGAEPIGESAAGRAFLGDALIEEEAGQDVRLFVPLLDGTDRVGVLAFTATAPDENDRRLARRFGGLLADVLVCKSLYTDHYFQIRRHEPMSLSAEMQWSLLPPLMMTTAQVAVAGILEPAYSVAGDSFDYALNDDTLHVGFFDAMGHGLDAAVIAAVAVAAYRHARRGDVELPELYTSMDHAIAGQFGQERFVTAQLARLNVSTGQLQWVNAGHPAPLLLREKRVVRALHSRTTLPAGLGGDPPQVGEEQLEPGDRILFFTDGIIEERITGGEQIGETRLIRQFEHAEQDGGPVQHTVRRLSHALMAERGGATSDDATLFLMEWRGRNPHDPTTAKRAL